MVQIGGGASLYLKTLTDKGPSLLNMLMEVEVKTVHLSSQKIFLINLPLKDYMTRYIPMSMNFGIWNIKHDFT